MRKRSWHRAATIVLSLFLVATANTAAVISSKDL